MQSLLSSERELSLFNHCRTISRKNNLIAFYENDRDNFESKWNKTFQNVLTTESSFAIANSFIPISNDPESIGTPLMDLNTIIGQINSLRTYAGYITDFCTSFSVKHNPVYQSLGFIENFTITVYIVHQALSNGEFSGIPKLKDVISFFESDGVTPIPVSPISPLKFENPNITPITYIQLSNSKNQSMPTINVCISNTLTGSYFSYKQDPNNNSLPISGGIYMFATKSQVIVSTTQDSFLNKPLSRDQLEALKKIDRYETYQDEEEDEEKYHKTPTGTSKGETSLAQFNYLEETKFLAYYNRVIINV